MIKIDIFDKINNKLIVSFIKQILHRCSCKVISSYIRKLSTFQKKMFDSERKLCVQMWSGENRPYVKTQPGEKGYMLILQTKTDNNKQNWPRQHESG